MVKFGSPGVEQLCTRVTPVVRDDLVDTDSHCHHTVAPPSASLSSSLSLRSLLVQSEISKHDVIAGNAAKLCVIEIKL